MLQSQKLLLKTIREKGRILTSDEAFNFYIENVMRNDVTCRLNRYSRNIRHDDYPMWELQTKAQNWHMRAIGSLVYNGHIVAEIK